MNLSTCGRAREVLDVEAALCGRLSLARTVPGYPRPRLADRYEIRSIVGTGGFGTVVRAKDRKMPREVAVKCIPVTNAHQAQTELAAEVDALCRVSARVPEVVTLYDCHAIEVRTHARAIPCLALAMDYVGGQSLRTWAARPRPREETLRVLASAARGLEAAHARNIVHRDFKPENVIVTERGEACLVDFGLAYRARRWSIGRPPALRGQCGVGTPGYMAPEQKRGDVSTRSDQFAFAVTAWELLTGVRPIRAGTNPNDPRGFDGAGRLPRRLVSILGRSLKADPRARFDSVADLRVEIERTLDLPADAATVIAGGAAIALTATTMLLALRKK